MEKKYKVLCFGDVIVDPDRLGHGIYAATTPSLFHQSDTIERVHKRIEHVLAGFIVEKALDNLKLCRFRTVTINFVDDEND